jgi:Set1/Ash2 histone methyltransferase complex subunit ASH2
MSEKVELSDDDGLTASSTKGHRMHGARHPRGSGLAPGTSRRSCTSASAGRLTGLTSRRPLGMTRMGLGTATTLMVHKAWREKYAHEGYREGDVLGFYISLADGEQQPDVIQYRGVPCHVQVPEEHKTPDPFPGDHFFLLLNARAVRLPFP